MKTFATVAALLAFGVQSPRIQPAPPTIDFHLHASESSPATPRVGRSPHMWRSASAL